MRKLILRLFIFFTVSVMFNSCLTVETKEYTFEFTGRNKGTLTIKYNNIMSMPDYFSEDEISVEDLANSDFEDLIFTYLTGDRIESDYPLATNFRKRLFEENGVLCGEIKMDFDNLEAVRLYQLSRRSPYMFSMSSAVDGETLINTNGEVANPEFMNIVYWKHNKKKLKLTTMITGTGEETVSLLEHYRRWKN